MIAVLSTLPFYYLFKSRLKSHYEQFSWILIYVIPVFYLLASFSEISIFMLAFFYVISLAIFFSIYETGYLENDLVTTLKESQPTIRISEQARQVLSKNYFIISLIKTLLALALISAIDYMAKQVSINLYSNQFIISLIVMRLVYFFHNIFRSRINVLTFFGLSLSKYISPLLLFVPVNESLELIVISFFIFPLIRTLEHATKEKYDFKTLRKLMSNHDLFRVQYYFIGMILAFLVVVYADQPYYVLIIFFYYFLARLSGLVLLRIKSNEVAKFRANQRKAE